jgi:hypothetical protein
MILAMPTVPAFQISAAENSLHEHPIDQRVSRAGNRVMEAVHGIFMKRFSAVLSAEFDCFKNSTPGVEFLRRGGRNLEESL